MPSVGSPYQAAGTERRLGRESTLDNATATSLESKIAPAAILTVAVGEDIDDLKKAILFRWGQSEKELGPLFWKLRSKLKAQGQKGKGFGSWLDAHGIPRTTADRWANNYEIRIGLRRAKEPKSVPLSLATTHAAQPTTFPQQEKSEMGHEVHVVDTSVYVERIVLAFSREQRKAFEEGEQKLRSIFGTSSVTDTVYAIVMERVALLAPTPTIGPEVRQ